MPKTITICSSASFYKQVLQVEKKLTSLGFNVVVPAVARIMEKNGIFEVEHYKTWYKNKNDYHKKTKLVIDHFHEIQKGDAILVLNYEKNGQKGYIGGNVLMEMTVAFYLNKKIYIFDEIDENSILKEEIYCMNPVFFSKDLLRVDL